MGCRSSPLPPKLPHNIVSCHFVSYYPVFVFRDAREIKTCIKKLLRSRANRVITTTDGFPSWYALIGRRSTAGGLLEAILYSSFRRELPTTGRILKKTKVGPFSKRAAVRPLGGLSNFVFSQKVQRYAPWGRNSAAPLT